MVVFSVITFVVFAVDKNSAIHHRWRIPEKRMHILEMLGGWPGALCAAFVLRHKIRKASYMAVMFFIIVGWVLGGWYFRSYIF